jgi:geranylgeranyl diphosphate synthase type I
MAESKGFRHRFVRKERRTSLSFDKFLKEKASIINKTIEKYIPRAFSRKALLFRVNEPRHSYNLNALNKAIADPVWEFLDRGGKRWRPALFLLVCEALGKNSTDFVDFAVIPEVVHNGTLMVDDIEDCSECRRGKPCTYRIFGLDIAINAGNAMYYLPLLALLENSHRVAREKLTSIYEVYAKEMVNLSLGQAMDIAWHKGLVDADGISEKDYLQMCAYKTGALARMAAKVAAILSNADEQSIRKLGSFAESLGIAFQIEDDVLDLTSAQFGKKKGGRGKDITEGKRSLPVIRAIKVASVSDRKRLIEILNKHTSDQKLREEAIAIMQKYGSIEYAKRFARRMVTESWNEAERLVPESAAKERLKAFAEFLVERKT